MYLFIYHKKGNKADQINPTLGEIKAYCEEIGIKFQPTIKTPSVVENIQMYGDVSAETYFNFYIANKEQIDNWVIYRRSTQLENESKLSM